MMKQYKNYLDIGTNEGLRYDDFDKSRFVSFSICVDHLQTITKPNIVELGTCRSFVDGKFEGCNSPDIKYWNKDDSSKWDWGAGCFGLLFGSLSKVDITTVDLMSSHIERFKHMADSLNIKYTAVVSDSVNFLKTTNKKFDLIYLDTGDMWPIDPTCQLQLDEAKTLIEKDLLNKNGLILIDDVLNGTPREQGDLSNTLGKSELAIPYLLENGFEIIFEGYQYILRKK